MRTHRKMRFRFIAKWLGLSLCLAMLPYTCSNIGNTHAFIYRGNSFEFWLIYNAIDVKWTGGTPKGWSVETELYKKYNGLHYWSFRRYPGGFILPMFQVLFYLTLMTALLWWLDRTKRVKPGHCRTCNYRLRGNTSGVCPECGTPVSHSPGQLPPNNQSAS